MAKPQKTLEDRLDSIRVRKQQLIAREQKLQADQRDRDLRRRAKAEKLLVQLVLDRAGSDDAFRGSLLDQIEASAFKPEDREALVAILLAAVPATSKAAA